MPIRVKCGGCKKTLSVKDHLAGKKIKCPLCQTVVAVASSTEPKPSAPIAAPAPKSSPDPKKPGVATKPVAPAKPPGDKSQSNGVPSNGKLHSNGVPAPPALAPVELPPENVEEEALAAFADEPKPAEEVTEPQFIEFKCDWCDEMVKQPIDMGGKQAQCPNPECRRLVKVPLPKKAEKKDWRKMDRQGPAAARINQPEQLEDAWGTENQTRARQDSLAQAGVLVEPPKKSIGVIGWMIRGVLFGGGAIVLLVAVAFGAYRLYSNKQQHNALEEIRTLAVGPEAKIKQPVLVAEAQRTLGLLQLRDGKAFKAQSHFQGAQSLAASVAPDNKNFAINEQLFLIDLAMAQIEMGGDEANDRDDIFAKKKIDWSKVLQDLTATIGSIKHPDAQAIALREVGNRLFERRQQSLAISLAAKFSVDPGGQKHPPFRQQIAFRIALPDGEKKLTETVKKPIVGKDTFDSHARVGFAEGYARKDVPDFGYAFNLAQAPGLPKDQFDTHIGVAAVALQRKEKDECAKHVKEALRYAKDMKDRPWPLLHLVKLAARTDEDAETIKGLIKELPTQFQLRGQLEVFLAQLDKSSGAVAADVLQELETADKDGTTLALAWMALAQHNTHKAGTSRDRNRAAFDERMAVFGPSQEIVDKVRPMVDIGSYLGTLK